MGCASSVDSVPSPTFRGTLYRRSSREAPNSLLPRISSRTKVKDETCEQQLLTEKVRAKRIAELNEKHASGAVDDDTFQQLYKVESKRRFIFASEEQPVTANAPTGEDTSAPVSGDESATLGPSPSPPSTGEGPPSNVKCSSDDAADDAAESVGRTDGKNNPPASFPLVAVKADSLTAASSLPLLSSHDLTAATTRRTSSCLKSASSCDPSQRKDSPDKEVTKHVRFTISKRGAQRKRSRSLPSGRVSPVVFQVVPDDETFAPA